MKYRVVWSTCGECFKIMEKINNRWQFIKAENNCFNDYDEAVEVVKEYHKACTDFPKHLKILKEIKL